MLPSNPSENRDDSVLLQRLQRDPVALRLMHQLQRNFPLSVKPFATVAEYLDLDEARVLDTLRQLQSVQLVSRLGPVFSHRHVGASILAAVSVAEDRIDEVAEVINRFASVNHNYRRDHVYNLWFVVTASDAEALQMELQAIEQAVGLPMLRLPMQRSYYIDLGFPLLDEPFVLRPYAQPVWPVSEALTALQSENLRAHLEQGIALESQPWRSLAQNTGLTTEQVRNQIRCWLHRGVIKRFGVVVNHPRLGFHHNAMLVWDVEDADVDMAGMQLANSGLINLCYLRKRQLPEWRYNLFCMIHCRTAQEARARVQLLQQLPALRNRPCDVLHSMHQYKQQGGRFARRLSV